MALMVASSLAPYTVARFITLLVVVSLALNRRVSREVAPHWGVLREMASYLGDLREVARCSRAQNYFMPRRELYISSLLYPFAASDMSSMCVLMVFPSCRNQPRCSVQVSSFASLKLLPYVFYL